MKADRLPRWAQRRLNAEQRAAYDRLRWHQPASAERARLKTILGWKRTREETEALATELLEQGLLERVVADRLGVSDRYLRRLVAGSQATPRIAAPDPSTHAAEVAPTCETDPALPPTRPKRSPLRFGSFRDLDEWLGEA